MRTLILLGMGKIASKCYAINPTDTNRTTRDGTWLRKYFKETRTSITECFQKFTKSGNQDLENKYDSWYSYAKYYSDPVIYSFCVLSYSNMDNFGKSLPLKVQRESGVIGMVRRNNTFINLNDDEINDDNSEDDSNCSGDASMTAAKKKRVYSQTEGAKQKRRRRAELKQEAHITPVVQQSSNEQLSEILNSENQMQALIAIIQYGDPQDKSSAMKKLKEIGKII